MEKHYWSELAAPYFISICHAVMDSYFENQGFMETEAPDTSGVLYFRGGIFVKVGHDIETSPNYSPIVNIGFTQGGSIGMWRVIPENCTEDQYWNWRFTNQVDLEEVLADIRDKVIHLYASRLWNNPSGLKLLVEQETEKTKSRFQKEAIRQKKESATVAWESCDYALAYILYSELEPGLLSAVELKRFHLCQKYIIESQL